jgi:predicted MPP superfamily phosphohydrolase
LFSNQYVALNGFDLAGVEDWTASQFTDRFPDLATAIEGRNKSRPLILLAHQPKEIHQVRELKSDRVDLQISGHTHGGQVKNCNLSN